LLSLLSASRSARKASSGILPPLCGSTCSLKIWRLHCQQKQAIYYSHHRFIERLAAWLPARIQNYSLRNLCTGLDRPWGLQQVETPRIYRQSAQEGGKVVSPTHRSPLPPRIYSCYSFLLEAESTPGP
jgi:hypothetical protein